MDVLVHGATAGGWYWRRVAPRLRAAGHTVHTPTLTGLGERVHLATPAVGLDTHVQDVVNVLCYEDLREVVLVGKRYAGMVITGVAARCPERLARLVFLDAAVPHDGQSLVDVVREAGGPAVDAALAQWRATGDGWHMPLGPGAGPRLTPQPPKTLLDPVAAATPGGAALPRTYISCTAKAPGLIAALTAAGAAVARAAGWHYRELPTVHEPEQHLPGKLTDLLLEAAAAGDTR
jgi:pimeloyl-ACP methyl ester carboxylesterase